MTAYYNEHDPNAAAWLRELIKDGLISNGEVDERSIEDVLPADVAGFSRCHFFAGIGVWDYALQLAGWPDQQVWTGSCPCQPFSAAGKGEGFADERHLWPAWFHLIEVCRPHTIFGEQVASKDGLTWLDLVSADVEGIGYRIAPIDIPVAGVGAPHKRQRLFFVADADRNGFGRSGIHISERPERQAFSNTSRASDDLRRNGQQANGKVRKLAVPDGGNASTEGLQRSGEHRQRAQNGRSGQLADAENRQQRRLRECRPGNGPEELQTRGRSPANGFWFDAEWIYCRDGKYRPTKPGIFPLANGTPGRVALLRGAGNAISPWVAKAFIESYLEEGGI